MRNSWILAIFGILAVWVCIWFTGPLVPLDGTYPLASAPVRALISALFALQFLAVKLWQFWRARQTNERLISALAPTGVAGGSVEMQQIRERFAAALAALRRARFSLRQGAGLAGSWQFWRPYFYQLPWYMIIGAPGAGKTTALMNAGLNFTLADQLGTGAVRGVGGTSHCDWWFTNQAVLLDTAGRFTTHDTDPAADRQAWGGFLELLRSTRPKRPLNGVLVAVSVADMLQLSADGIVEHGRMLRARLDELQMALRVRLPVYFILTKCDLLPGFMEWFGAFDRERRDQIWGITCDLRASDTGQSASGFAAEFERLVDALADRMPARLRAERDLQRCGRLFSLPPALRGLGGSFDLLIRRAFGPSATTSGAAVPCLRGVYLTSGTQQGTPIDRTLFAFGRELGLDAQILPPNPNSGKSFFISRLLTDVVYVEADLSGDRLLAQRTRRRLRLGLIVAVQLCAVAIATWWVNSYVRTVDQLTRLETEAGRVRELVDAMPTRASANPRPLLPALNATSILIHNSAGGRSSEFLEPGGRARAKLSAAARDAYDRILLGPFQQRIGSAIDTSLRSGVDVNVQYEGLKAYSMLSDPAHFDAAGFKIFVMSYFDSALSPPWSFAERRELEEHLDALVEAGAVQSGIAIQASLVESVRGRLSTQSPAQRIALRVGLLLASRPHEDFTVASLGPNAADSFVGSDGRQPPRAVPGRYTLEAFHDIVAAEAPVIAAQLTAEAPWVLGTSPVDDRMAIGEFRAAYGRAYAQAWADFISDLHLRKPVNTQDAIQLARTLGAADGPMAALLNAIVHQTAPGLLDGGDGPIPPTDPLASRFIALAQITNPGGTHNGAPALDSILELFRELAGSRDRIVHVLDRAAHEPEPIHAMLLGLAAQSSGAPADHGSDAAAPLPRQVATRLGVPCIQLVAGHFPFDRSSTRDASLEDFARLFGPQGEFDTVFKQLIAPHIDTSTDAWAPRDANGTQVADELDPFRSAAHIRTAFFSRGEVSPSIQLTIGPVEADSGIVRFQLEADGQMIRYTPGQNAATTINWPGSRGNAKIDVAPAAEGGTLEFSGPWALFRLFDHAAIKDTGSPGRFRAVFKFGGHRVSFDVESSTGDNPFRLRELERFECPIGGL